MRAAAWEASPVPQLRGMSLPSGHQNTKSNQNLHQRIKPSQEGLQGLHIFPTDSQNFSTIKAFLVGPLKDLTT